MMNFLACVGLGVGFRRGLVILGAVSSALACSAKDASSEGEEPEPDEVAELEPGEQQCSEANSGRVCVEGQGGDEDAGVSDIDLGLSAGADGGTASADGGSPLVSCPVIRGIVRDFRRGDQEGGHPDFETQMGSGEKGMLEPVLDDAGRPQLKDNEFVSIRSEESFGQWYRDVPEVNETFDVSLELTEEDGYQVFGTTTFFPLDGLGFGSQGQSHNFGFTTELHARFAYEGSGSFQLAGDDDLWLFVNGQLAIDLGGVHGWQSFTLNLSEIAETMGLEVGSTYTLDIFHAERHSTESKFYAKTDLLLVDCEL